MVLKRIYSIPAVIHVSRLNLLFLFLVFLKKTHLLFFILPRSFPHLSSKWAAACLVIVVMATSASVPVFSILGAPANWRRSGLPDLSLGSRATRRASSVNAGGVNGAISTIYKHTAPGSVGRSNSRARAGSRRRSSKY